MKRTRPARLRRTHLLALAPLMLALTFADCGRSPVTNDASPTPTSPDNTNRSLLNVNAEAKVRRNADSVRAGKGEITNIPLLPDDDWHDLEKGGYVTTDPKGEAWLDIKDCSRLYVFQRSDLVVSHCPDFSYTRGTPVCDLNGAVALRHKCADDVAIVSGSTVVQASGTWLFVIYDRPRKLSLVGVLEGEALVRPVMGEGEKALGEPVRVKAGNFYFSTPGAEAAALAGLSAREPHPFEQLGPLVGELGIGEWLGHVKERAEADGVKFPGLSGDPTPPTVTPTPAAPKPDLVITALEVMKPPVLARDGSITAALSVLVKNQGEGAAAFEGKVGVSYKFKGDTGDFREAVVGDDVGHNVSGLPPGGVRIFNLSVYIPPSKRTAPVAHPADRMMRAYIPPVIIFKAKANACVKDPACHVAESDESNNESGEVEAKLVVAKPPQNPPTNQKPPTGRAPSEVKAPPPGKPGQ